MRSGFVASRDHRFLVGRPTGWPRLHRRVSEALAGHEVGTDDSWIHDLDAGFGWPPVSSESFHPTAEGQDAVSGMVQKQLENGGR